MDRLRGALGGILVSVLVAACATPAARIANFAARSNFQQLLLQGGGFNLVAFFKPGIDPRKNLHIYIEHDGPAWSDEQHVSADPTPRHALMLAAMAQDTSPSLYLGRPCYLGRHNDTRCGPMLWTHERYSEAVVSAMASALEGFLSSRTDAGVIFLGYSGGGTLAVLLAERFPHTRAVITIGGNLDIEAWAKRHDYSPLVGSLNPARREPLPSSIMQHHYVGGRDTNVPPEMIESIPSLPVGSVIKVSGFDHTCCWQAWWPNVLRDLEDNLATR
jgi:pimeloyl-ACP methyl ester carboxylesterase